MLTEKTKKFLANIVFWLHLPIVLLLFGLFFVPRSLWPGRVAFHFWFVVGLLTINISWGFFMYRYTKKIDQSCPLTTLMQWLRGHPIDSPENYKHSYIAELLEKINALLGRKDAKFSKNTITILFYSALIGTVIEYILFR